MRPTEPTDTPPWGAVPIGVIDRSLTKLDDQCTALHENGATHSALAVAEVRNRLARKTKHAPGDLNWTSVPDAADRLGVSEPTIVRRIAAGRLQGHKVGGRYIVFEESIAQALQNSRTGEQEGGNG